MKTTKEISPKRTSRRQKSVKIDPCNLPAIAPGENAAQGNPFFSFDAAGLFPVVPDSSILLVGTGRDDFMASRFAHAVEDADASLLNMNVTSLYDDENRHVVELRVSHRDPERVARSLERYGYNIISSRGVASPDSDSLSSRLDELMHYLSI